MTLLLLLSCAPRFESLPPGAAPDVLLMYTSGALEIPGVQVVPASTDPALARHALLTGTWGSPSASAVWEIAGFYGWHTETFSAECVADALGAWWSWRLEQTDDRLFGVVHGGACAGVDSDALFARLKETGLEGRTLVVIASDQGKTISLRDPFQRAMTPAPWSTLDVAPTILAALGATVPTDAAGRDLLRPDPEGPVVTLSDDKVMVYTSMYRMEAPVPLDPATATLLGQPDDPAAKATLFAAASRAWAQAYGTSAREKMQGEALQNMLQERGYWP